MKELLRRYKIQKLLNNKLTEELLAIDYLISIFKNAEINTFEKYPNEIYYHNGDYFYFYTTNDYKGYEIECLIYRCDLLGNYNLDYSESRDIIRYLSETFLNLVFFNVYTWEFSGEEILSKEYNEGILKKL